MELNKKTLKHIFVGVAACIILYWVLHETERVKSAYEVVKGVLAPFIIGAALAFIINVPMRSIENQLTRIRNEKLR